MIFKTCSAQETEDIGARFAAALDTGGVRSAFVALRGEMGVGKTAFTRGFASHFGITAVKSPTYTVVNEYRGKAPIFHFDMYRIESEDDLYSIGYDDYIERDGYSIVEWSENIDDMIPHDAIFVTILRIPGNDSGREIKIEMGEKYENISI